MLLRLKVSDELVLAWDAIAKDAARAEFNMAMICRSIFVSSLDVPSQVSFTSVVVHTELVWAEVTLWRGLGQCGVGWSMESSMQLSLSDARRRIGRLKRMVRREKEAAHH